MFIVLLNYKKPLDIIDQHLVAHRAFLDTGYQQGYLLMSGPTVPRVGGVIISLLKNKLELEKFLQQDPFYILALADYQITEFTPVKYHDSVVSLI